MKQGKKIVAILLVLSLCLPFNLVTQAAKKTIVNAQYSLCKGNSILVKKTGLKGRIKWTSSNKSCVGVNSSGQIKAKKAGKATVTARAGKKTYKILVKVQKSVISKKVKTIGKNEYYKLSVLKNKDNVKWTSKNTKIARVSSKGVVVGVKPGKTTVTAKIKQGTLSCKIIVKPNVHKHNFMQHIKQKASCDKEGIIEYKCTDCDKEYKKYIDALGHNFIKKVVPPTCMQRGYTEYVCKYDKAHTYRSDYVKAGGHNWNKGRVVKEASPEEDGEKRFTCKVCGAEKTEKILWKTEQKRIFTDKDIYVEGEDIKVAAQGDDDAWVGIYAEVDSVRNVSPIYRYNVSDSSHQSGKTYIIQKESFRGRNELFTLPAGKYKVILFKNENYDVDDFSYIKIKDNGEAKLQLNKKVYGPGERIMVTAKGSDADWVGIYAKNDLPNESEAGGVKSIYWYYVAKDGHSSGKAYAINKIGYYNAERSQYKNLPVGEYKALLFKDGKYEAVEQIDFAVEGDNQPMAPATVEYVLDKPGSGLANGKVTVTLNEADHASSDVIMYWADDDGPLSDYTSLAKFKISGETTEFKMYENTIIPEGATRLLVYTTNTYGTSSQYTEVKLPEGSNFKFSNEKPITEFEMVSDVHITDRSMGETDINYKNNQHFKQMLEDVQKNSPDSKAIIINGDIADTGKESEYKNMQKIYSQVSGLPDIYMAVGNHDLSANDYKTQAELFIKYANTGTGKVYYDRMINGYHYIFLGSEKQGLRADLSEAQLKWFDELLAKDTAANPEKPVFVMLHQSLYNTVAGSLPGQNWDGAGSEGTAQAKQLRAILKKYPQVLMFNGHSHWELNSEKCMYARDEELPNIFNTAAVGYLWSSYDDIVGSYTEGSNGYVIKVYKDKVMVLGRDFENGKYVSSAMFVAQNYKK